MSEKTYGKIMYEAGQKYFEEHVTTTIGDKRLPAKICSFEECWPVDKEASEYAAQAVIAEFCKRHNIHLHIGGKPEDAATRLLQWVERKGDVTEIHITIPGETEGPDQG